MRLERFLRPRKSLLWTSESSRFLNSIILWLLSLCTDVLKTIEEATEHQFLVDLSKYLVKPGLYFISNPDGGPCIVRRPQKMAKSSSTLWHLLSKHETLICNKFLNSVWITTGSTIRFWHKVKTWLDQMFWQIYQKLMLSGFLSSGNLCLIHHLKKIWPHTASTASVKKSAIYQWKIGFLAIHSTKYDQ